MTQRIVEIVNYYTPLIDAALDKVLKMPEGSGYSRLFESIRYSIFAGGKRLRPILALLSYKAFGKDSEEEIIPLVSSLEMVHTYSLIHDDLPAMDNDDLRRGKPTNHKVFGDGMAVLAGDGLLTLAFENIVIQGRELHLSPECINSLILCLSSAVGPIGMVGGQGADLLSENRDDLTIEDIRFIHINKTAKFISASLAFGAYIANAINEEIKVITDFGIKIGLAFQVVDDILDITSDEQTLGKPIRSDIDRGKATYPAILGLEESKTIAYKLVNEAKAALTTTKIETTDLFNMADYILNRSK